MNGHRPAQDASHIFLRPIGGPLPLGMIALGNGSEPDQVRNVQNEAGVREQL